MAYQQFQAQKMYTTFLSIPLSPEIREHIKSVQKKLKKIENKRIEWEAPEKLHCTLLFLGKITAPQQQLVGNLMYQIAGTVDTFPVTIGHIDYFFKRHQDGVVWLSVYDQQQFLIDIHRFLVKELNLQGFSLSYKKIVPHITIGRLIKVHGQQRQQLLDNLAQVELQNLPQMKIDRVQLVQSQFKQQVSTTDYKVLKEYRLIPLDPLTGERYPRE